MTGTTGRAFEVVRVAGARASAEREHDTAARAAVADLAGPSLPPTRGGLS